MAKIRVLVVDDAVVVRSRVSKILAADPEIEVAGIAANGSIALAKLPQVNPDVVILDVEMPEMDGLETLEAIRQTYPRLPVIMFSILTTKGAIATLEALSRGASDYVSKPTQMGSVEAANQHIRETLIPKIKLLGTPYPDRLASDRSHSDFSNSPAPSSLAAPVAPNHCFDRSPSAIATSSEPIELVAIGVSTGGPNALGVILSQLPADFPVPILIVQHMPPLFTQLLAERLTTKCLLPVQEAIAGTILQPGTVWIAPGNYHLVVQRQGLLTRLGLHQAPPENSCRPSVDVLLNSVAQVFGGRSLAVILTGMGQDGWRGCEQIRERGGRVLVQDAASSVVWGMPGFVAKAGLAEAIVPLSDMAAAVIERVVRSRL